MNFSNSAFIFPGQGSQSPKMLSDYFDHQKIFCKTFDEARSILDIDFRELIESSSADDLASTEITQPLMLIANIAIWRSLNTNASSVFGMAGHSLGEFAALVASDSISFSDALELVTIRANLMQLAVPEENGAIAAIMGLNLESIKVICNLISEDPDELVETANLNSPVQTVISGTKSGVNKAIELCLKDGAKRAIPLAMSVPSHCGLMKSAAEKFALKLDHFLIKKPSTKIFQNYSAISTDSPDVIKENLVKQIYNPVRWVETIQNINAEGVANYYECGPSKVLSGLIKRILDSPIVTNLNDYENLKNLTKKV